MRTFRFTLNVVLLSVGLAPAAAQAPFAIEELTIAQLHAALANGTTSCRAVVQAYLDRIAAYDQTGPRLDAMRALNPNALDEAEAFDRAGAARTPGPLGCVPLVLKDNYDTADMPTTGGSASLAGAQPTRDAFTVAKLRAAGAIILGKTNMHEFALAGTSVSSLGGQVRNPYDLTRTPGGSSGGTGAAVAANLALGGTGTDTENSIRSPPSANALDGLRPTHGLVSLSGIMPVSRTQDSAGPIARTVADLSALLQVMAGTDPADPRTVAASGKVPDSYADFLKSDALRSARLGVVRGLFGTGPESADVERVMDDALDALRAAGATLIEIDDTVFDAGRLKKEDDVQSYEFKTLIDRYLATIPNAPHKSLAAIIASGLYDKPTLETFLKTAEARRDGMAEPEYRARLDRIAALKAHLASVFDRERLDAMVYPLQKQLVVPIGAPEQAGRNGILAALTGSPAIDLPAGFSTPSETAPIGVPVGMDLLGRPWSEGRLLGFAYAFEQATHLRRPPRSTVPVTGHGASE